MKLHKEIGDEAYNREYQRLNREPTDLRIKKDEKTKLQKTRITTVKDIIGED